MASDLNAETVHKVVAALIGPVTAVGETRSDEKRLENLKTLTELTEILIGEIADAAVDESRQEWSMKAIGQHAAKFLREIRA